MGYEQEQEAARDEMAEFRRCHRSGMTAHQAARLMHIPLSRARLGLAWAAGEREPLAVACDACGCELRTAIAEEGGYVVAMEEDILLKYGPLARAQAA